MHVGPPLSNQLMHTRTKMPYYQSIEYSHYHPHSRATPLKLSYARTNDGNRV